MTKKKYIIPIFVPHLGCPHDCIFCNQRKITNHKDAVNIDEIIETIETQLSYFPETDNEKEIAFFGGSFTAINMEAMLKYLSIAKSYKDKGIIDKVRLSTRPDAIDRIKLDILKEYGVDIIELGVQSMVDEILFANNRGHDAKSVVEASMLIKEYGFTLGHQIMPGLYKDSEEAMIYTAEKSIELKPDIVRIYPTLVIKDTFMEYLYKEGLFKPLSLDQAIDISAKLLMMYKEAKITVIRIGLQVTDNINLEGDVVAGPFHSSLRQLVEQKLYLEKLEEIINKYQLNRYEEVSINCHKSLTSYLVGNKSYNKKILRQMYGFKSINYNAISDLAIELRAGDEVYQVGVL